MNIAIIIASGTGVRTGSVIPKQFVSVCDKPIIVYTLERFQSTNSIDAIEVVCLSGWEETLKAYASQYGITKLKWIVEGGLTAQESIYNGIKNLNKECKSNDIIIIHDGIRPMVENDIIDSCISVCNSKGNGVSVLPVYEQVFRENSEDSSKEYIPRESLRIMQTPQAYHFAEIRDAYEEALKKGIGCGSSSYANTLMADLGRTLYFSKGSTKNIKITTKDDIEMFKAMMTAK